MRRLKDQFLFFWGRKFCASKTAMKQLRLSRTTFGFLCAEGQMNSQVPLPRSDTGRGPQARYRASPPRQSSAVCAKRLDLPSTQLPKAKGRPLHPCHCKHLDGLLDEGSGGFEMPKPVWIL